MAQTRRLAGRQAQPRQQQLAVLEFAPGQISRHHERSDGAQSDNRGARFVEPPHMGIARGEKTE